MNSEYVTPKIELRVKSMKKEKNLLYFRLVEKIKKHTIWTEIYQAKNST